MDPEKFSPQDSLSLIQNMIAKTRQDMGDNSSYFLLWGWITLVACLGEYVLKNVFHYEKHYLVWLLIIPGVIISIYLGIKDKKKQRVNTYIGESMKYLWMGMGISYFVLCMILGRMGSNANVFPFFMLLYGLGTFVSGQFLQFKPFIWGGVAAWALAITSAYFDYDYQMLFGAAAILVSYIIPAYMLRYKNKSSHNI